MRKLDRACLPVCERSHGKNIETAQEINFCFDESQKIVKV
jgi:hypothetical protein